ncbi:MAG: hypothetical protein ACM3Q2_08945, partial [Syntrophothermus sp.]
MNKIILALLITVCSDILIAQTMIDKPVIEINNKIIRQSEFKNRLNGLPQISDNEIEVKENLICTLIAESILASEAAKENLNTNEQLKLLSG